MKLLRETLVNFKGIRDYTFSPQGASVSVSGDNGSGKTSLLDGFLWVLFDRDSAGHRDFELKTLDESGAVIPMLEHSVEIEIEHQGRRRQLKKTLSENWVRARGAATTEFSGHRTVYEFDHVPLQKKEYDAAIAAMCDETLLRILTDPLYFAAKLPWQDRRRILLELCGELSEAELIATDARLTELPALLAGRSLEEFRRQLAAQKQLVNSELKAIPVRVDEVTRAMPADEPLASPAGESTDAGRLVQLQAAAATQETERRRLTQQCQQAESELAAANRRRGELENEVARLATKLAEKRDAWNRQNSRSFVWDSPDRCPTCGQAIPAELAEQARQKAAAQFATEQSEQLNRLTAEGQALLASEQQKQQDVQTLIASLPTLETAVGAANTALAHLQEASADPGELTAARQAAADLARRQAVAEQRQQAVTRIAELQRREQSLAAEYAELERQQFLGEEFLRVKVARLEERINGCFRLARFRLFEQQVNGALCEVCEVLGPDLVPFNSGLNHAACINTGLDIINSLSVHYGLTAPIFIDNAEAVTTLIDTPAQLIRLLVSEDEPALAMRQDAKPADVVAMVGAEPVSVSGPGF